MGCHQPCRNTPNMKPSWLRATIADLEQRYHSLSSLNHSEREDSLADRAENYYRRRPQLISLLQDLYGRYLSLADRYSQVLKPQHNPFSSSKSQFFVVHSDLDDADDSVVFTDATPEFDTESDADSSLSFQTPKSQSTNKGSRSRGVAPDRLVEGIVTEELDNAILKHEVQIMEQRHTESSKKVGLQRSLLEVLESERMVLLTENARLGFQAIAAEEENVGLVAEVEFARKKATEMARCMVKLQEEQRVFASGRKIEELQTQIYGLEKRKREYYEEMARKEEEKEDMLRGLCAEMERIKAENQKMRERMEAAAVVKKKRRNKGAAVVKKKRRNKGWMTTVVRKVRKIVLCGWKMRRPKKGKMH